MEESPACSTHHASAASKDVFLVATHARRARLSDTPRLCRAETNASSGSGAWQFTTNSRHTDACDQGQGFMVHGLFATRRRGTSVSNTKEHFKSEKGNDTQERKLRRLSRRALSYTLPAESEMRPPLERLLPDLVARRGLHCCPPD